MRSTLGPSGAHDYDEPARPSWTFQQRIPVQAEKAEADDLPDDQPVAPGPASAVSPALVELGEAHFWPHARAAGDLSSPGAVKIVTSGDEVRGGLGLICAVEIVANRATKKPFPREAGLARRAGLLMERHGLLGRAGDVFFVAPPLSVTRSELDFLVNQLDAVIAELEAGLLARGRAA